MTRPRSAARPTKAQEKKQRARLGAALRGAREDRGLHQKAVADLLGQTWASVCDYESGRRAPPALTLLALGQALKADLNAIGKAVVT